MKQHVARTALLFVIRLFPAVASLVALILFSRFTPPVFYGKYQTFWVQWQVLVTIACLGLPALIYTYPLTHITGLLRDLHPNHKRGFLIWLVLVGVLFGKLQSLGAGPLFDPVYVTLFLFSTAVVALSEAYLLLGRQYLTVAITSCAYALFFVALHILFIRRSIDTADLFELLVEVNVARMAMLAWRSRKLYRTSAVDAFPLPIHKVCALWFHLGLYDLIQMLFRWIDKLVLSFLLTAPLFAVYFNGTIDVPFLPLLLGAAGNALLMQMNQQDAGDKNRVLLIRDSSATLSRIVFPVFFFLMCFSRELFEVVFHHKYDASVPLFLVSILVVPLRAYNFTSILQHLGKGRIINIGALLDLAIALVLMYPLYAAFGLKGIALSFVISTYFQAGFYLLHTARALNIKWYKLLPFRSWTKQAIAFGFVFFSLSYVLHLYFTSTLILFLGGGTLTVTMLLGFLPMLLSQRKNGTQ